MEGGLSPEVKYISKIIFMMYLRDTEDCWCHIAVHHFIVVPQAVNETQASIEQKDPRLLGDIIPG